MVTTPDSCHRPAEVSDARRRTLPGLLLALLGFWALAAMGTTVNAATGNALLGAGGFETAASLADDTPLLHSGQRRPGLQTLQPSCKEPDGNDSDAGGYATTTPWRADARDDPAIPPHRPSADTGLRRPLHGLPQSPRAPPSLA